MQVELEGRIEQRKNRFSTEAHLRLPSDVSRYLTVAPPGELSVPWHLISPMPFVSISEAAGVILRGSRLNAHNALSVNKAALMNEEVTVEASESYLLSPDAERGRSHMTSAPSCP